VWNKNNECGFRHMDRLLVISYLCWWNRDHLKGSVLVPYWLPFPLQICNPTLWWFPDIRCLLLEALLLLVLFVLVQYWLPWTLQTWIPSLLCLPDIGVEQKQQIWVREWHCISVFGGNGIASVFSEETALRYHFLRERRCVTVFGGNSKEQRCIRVYQRNGVAWGFTERTALFEGLPKERRYMGLYWWNGIAWASSRWQAVWKRL
jgi:hypothetical protein